MTSAEILSNVFNSGIKPDSVISVSEWADANRILSQTASSEPGKFRTSRTPYLKEIMDALSPSSSYEKGFICLRALQKSFTLFLLINNF